MTSDLLCVKRPLFRPTRLRQRSRHFIYARFWITNEEAEVLTCHLNNELAYLLQRPLYEKALRVGVIAHNHYFEAPKENQKFKVLSESGMIAPRSAIWEKRISRLKDMVSVLAPIGSLIVAVCGAIIAYFAFRKKTSVIRVFGW
jgi:hypothetical protein